MGSSFCGTTVFTNQVPQSQDASKYHSSEDKSVLVLVCSSVLVAKIVNKRIMV